MKWNRNEPDTLLQVPPVLRIGITGGIGSGKSYVCRQLEAVGHEVFYCDEEAKRIIRHDATVQQALRQLVGHEVYDAEGRLVKPVLAAYLCRGREYAAQVDAIVHPRVALAFAQRAWLKAHRTATAGGSAAGCPAPPSWTAALDGVAPQEVPVALGGILPAAPRICPTLQGCTRPLTLTPADLQQLDPDTTLFMECALLYESHFDHLVHRVLMVDAQLDVRLQRVMARDKVSEEKARAWMALQMADSEKRSRADWVVQN